MLLFSFLSTTHYRWMAVLWTGAIVAVCSLPAESLASVQPAMGADKVAHFGLFFVFGGLWMRALYPPGRSVTGVSLRRQVLRLLVGGGLLAGGTEVYQHLLPLQRMGDPYDALANGGGLLLSVIAYLVYLRVAGRREAAENPSAQPG